MTQERVIISHSDETILRFHRTLGLVIKPDLEVPQGDRAKLRLERMFHKPSATREKACFLGPTN